MSAMDQLYQEIILDHSKHPQHFGAQERFDAEVHHVNPTCGDEITLQVRLGQVPGTGEPVIEELSWRGQGCSISQASASVMAAAVTGEPVGLALQRAAEFRELMDGRGSIPPALAADEAMEDAEAFAGVAQYPARIKCALLGWMAMKDAVAQATPASHKETT